MSVTEFEIDRSLWLTGEHLAKSLTTASRLLDSAGRQCCLGFYAKACGLSEAQIRPHFTPTGLYRESNLPDEMSWLVDARYGETTPVADELMNQNDAWRLSRDERERRIAGLFQKHASVAVTFVGEYPQALTAVPMPDFIYVSDEDDED